MCMRNSIQNEWQMHCTNACNMHWNALPQCNMASVYVPVDEISHHKRIGHICESSNLFWAFYWTKLTVLAEIVYIFCNKRAASLGTYHPWILCVCPHLLQYIVIINSTASIEQNKEDFFFFSFWFCHELLPSWCLEARDKWAPLQKRLCHAM